MHYSLLRAVRPKFKTYPEGNAAIAIPYYRHNLGDTQLSRSAGAVNALWRLCNETVGPLPRR